MAKYKAEEFRTKNGELVTIRNCELSDVDAFLLFQPAVASETTNTLQMTGRIPERSKIEAAWTASNEDSIALRVSAFCGSKMIAQASFYPEKHPWTEHIGAFSMMILKEYWGQGLGRRLLEIIETHARKNGIKRIEARVRAKNERGIKLYRRMGYSIEGTRKKAAFIDHEFHDEYFIGKILDAPNDGWLPPILETERLILRPLEISDAPAIFEYARNPAVSKFTLWEPHVELKDSEDFILDYAFPHYREKTPEPFGLVLKDNPKQVIGTVGCFWVSRRAKSMELAYAIGESHWGKGLVAEASRAVVDFCFKEFDLTRMQCRCKAENKASARVMEKLGMKFEGTLRSAILHRDRHWDMHHYSILKSEWNHNKQ